MFLIFCSLLAIPPSQQQLLFCICPQGHQWSTISMWENTNGLHCAEQNEILWHTLDITPGSEGWQEEEGGTTSHVRGVCEDHHQLPDFYPLLTKPLQIEKLNTATRKSYQNTINRIVEQSGFMDFLFNWHLYFGIPRRDWASNSGFSRFSIEA